MGRAMIHLSQQTKETHISEILDTTEADKCYRSHFLTR